MKNLRPTEVETLLADPSYSEKNWDPKIKFEFLLF